MSTFTSRRFNQDASGAKRAAADGPVFITDRGRPAHVLMTIEDYEKLKAGAVELSDRPRRSIVDMLAMEGAGDDDEFDRILEEIRLASRQEAPRLVEFD